MNPATQKSIIRTSRIFGYAAAVCSIPFSLLGGLIASCCPLGVLVGAMPLLASSGLGAMLAALFLNYREIPRRETTGAGLRVGVRTATIAALGGGIITVFTASQTLTAITTAGQAQGTANDPAAGAIGAATFGFMNLGMLLLVVAACALPAILWGVIGAAIRSSAGLPDEPVPQPEWEAENRALRKQALIEWGVLFGLLVACAVGVPMVQQLGNGAGKPAGPSPVHTPSPSGSRQVPAMTVQQPPSLPTPAPVVPPAPVEPARIPVTPNPGSPPQVSPNGRYSVEVINNPEDPATYDRLLVIKDRGEPIFGCPTIGFLSSALWSPDGRFVAVNQRRGNAGDYLWIVDLVAPKAAKAPDDKLGTEIERRALEKLRREASTTRGIAMDVGRYWLSADSWLSSRELRFEFRGVLRPADGSASDGYAMSAFGLLDVSASGVGFQGFEGEGRELRNPPTIPARDSAQDGVGPIFPGERFPETRQRLLRPTDVARWTTGDFRYAINEMFARHGAEFGKEEVRRTFQQFNWYRPRPGILFDQIEQQEFSDAERANLKFLGAARDARLKGTGAPPNGSSGN